MITLDLHDKDAAWECNIQKVTVFCYRAAAEKKLVNKYSAVHRHIHVLCVVPGMVCVFWAMSGCWDVLVTQCYNAFLVPFWVHPVHVCVRMCVYALLCWSPQTLQVTLVTSAPLPLTRGKRHRRHKGLFCHGANTPMPLSYRCKLLEDGQKANFNLSPQHTLQC